MPDRPTLFLDEAPLSLETLAAIAERRVRPALSARAWGRIRAGRQVVDQVVSDGREAYGITTGVGSQKDFAVDRAALGAYNDALLLAHATWAPGRPARAEVIRAALALQLALFATGRSGIRVELAESLLARLAADDLPAARLGASVGASDLVAMAQLAAPLLAANAAPSGRGPKPMAGLAAKEALSLVNSNCLTLAGAVLAVRALRQLLDGATSVAALSLEGFRGNPSAWSAAVDAARGQPGQSRAGASLRAALADSRLWQSDAPRLLQDPLSFRCVPQIHGAAESADAFAAELIGLELSAASDNPLIDPEAGVFLSHGNMETTAVALALDTLRLAIAKVIATSGERVHKLQWAEFSGLPTGLAREAGARGGVQFLNIGHIAAAGVAAVCQAATPVVLGFRGQICDGVEDVAGNAPLAVEEAERLIEPAWNVVAAEAVCAAWAIDRRGLAVEALGRGVRTLYGRLRGWLPIGREGEALFDLAPIVAVLRDPPPRGAVPPASARPPASA